MRLIHDRRGITAMTFAVMAFALIGLVGLGTEAGGWIMTRNALQAAADGASIAASLAINANQDPIAAADDELTRNGFPPGASATPPAVNNLTPPGSYARAETIVTTPVVPLIASLFVGQDTFQITARSVSGIVPTGTACVLSTANDLLVNAGQYSTNCAYASDTNGGTSITVATSDTVDIYAWVTPGDCQGCQASTRLYTRPPATFQPPVIDPYAKTVQQALRPAMPVCGSARAVPAASYPFLVPATGVPGNAAFTGSGPYWAYCNTDVVVAASTNLILSPGIYFFIDSSLTVQNGATVRCEVSPGIACDQSGLILGTGVTLVFTGSGAAGSSSGAGPGCGPVAGSPPNEVTVTGVLPTGPSLTICPTANVLLSPPSAADATPENFLPALHGVLIWRDGTLPAGTRSAPVADIQASNPYSSITSGPPAYTVLNGLLYFPNGFVNFGANNAEFGGSVPQVACATLVAGGINLVNQKSIFQDCASRGFTTPRVLAVRVLE